MPIDPLTERTNAELLAERDRSEVHDSDGVYGDLLKGGLAGIAAAGVTRALTSNMDVVVWTGVGFSVAVALWGLFTPRENA